VMPGVIIIEALAQTSGILGFMTMDKTPESGSIYYFAGADNVRFRNPVVPGDTLDLFSQVIGNKRGIWKFQCKAMVEDKEACSATILCADRPK
jgi:3-hydroxyacyl-[acyl-carrier-protein] dehydratase